MERKDFVREPERETRIYDRFDVVVAGGGIAGIAAALASTRNGARTCLVERATALGGLATLGLIVDFLPLCDGLGNQVIGGIGEELLRLSKKYGTTDFPDCWKSGGNVEERRTRRYELTYNPGAMILAAEELLIREGVTLLYDARVCGVGRQDGRINTVLFECKEGRLALGCRTVIDTTGDADVCWGSGERTAVLETNVPSWWFYSRDERKVSLHRLTENFYDVPTGTHTYSGVNEQDVTEFLVETRQRIAAFLNYRNAGRATNDARYCLAHDGTPMARSGISPEQPSVLGRLEPDLLPMLPQFRMTRRLVGKTELDAAQNNIWFEDTVGMTGSWAKSGPVYYVPLSIMQGVANDNLLAAGRCVSATPSGLDILRVIPACAVTGEAAGTAAALAALEREGCIHELDLPELRRKLIGRGVLIDRRYCR